MTFWLVAVNGSSVREVRGGRTLSGWSRRLLDLSIAADGREKIITGCLRWPSQTTPA
jgi:hypothetical protein